MSRIDRMTRLIRDPETQFNPDGSVDVKKSVRENILAIFDGKEKGGMSNLVDAGEHLYASAFREYRDGFMSGAFVFERPNYALPQNFDKDFDKCVVLVGSPGRRLYIPLEDGDKANGQIIGADALTTPEMLKDGKGQIIDPTEPFYLQNLWNLKDYLEANMDLPWKPTDPENPDPNEPNPVHQAYERLDAMLPANVNFKPQAYAWAKDDPNTVVIDGPKGMQVRINVNVTDEKDVIQVRNGEKQTDYVPAEANWASATLRHFQAWVLEQEENPPSTEINAQGEDAYVKASAALSKILKKAVAPSPPKEY